MLRRVLAAGSAVMMLPACGSGEREPTTTSSSARHDCPASAPTTDKSSRAAQGWGSAQAIDVGTGGFDLIPQKSPPRVEGQRVTLRLNVIGQTKNRQPVLWSSGGLRLLTGRGTACAPTQPEQVFLGAGQPKTLELSFLVPAGLSAERLELVVPSADGGVSARWRSGAPVPTAARPTGCTGRSATAAPRRTLAFGTTFRQQRTTSTNGGRFTVSRPRAASGGSGVVHDRLLVALTVVGDPLVQLDQQAFMLVDSQGKACPRLAEPVDIPIPVGPEPHTTTLEFQRPAGVMPSGLQVIYRPEQTALVRWR